MPPQSTPLGGSIRIHGGGAGEDWTLGCIAMNDTDIKDLYSHLPPINTRVAIYQSVDEEKIINQKNYMNNEISYGAENLLNDGSHYTSQATRVIRMNFPMGDIDSHIGTCTDVVIRSLRYAGVDLQAQIYEDIILNPGTYSQVKKPSTHIDHRRVRNLKIWFDRHAVSLTHDVNDMNAWKPGDIVIMDTGVQNGTVFDHIGIVGREKQNNKYLVINLWTIGYTINEMNLLNGDYPTIKGHYRLKHLFYYQ